MPLLRARRRPSADRRSRAAALAAVALPMLALAGCGGSGGVALENADDAKAVACGAIDALPEKGFEPRDEAALYRVAVAQSAAMLAAKLDKGEQGFSDTVSAYQRTFAMTFNAKDPRALQALERAREAC